MKTNNKLKRLANAKRKIQSLQQDFMIRQKAKLISPKFTHKRKKREIFSSFAQNMIKLIKSIINVGKQYASPRHINEHNND